LREEGAAQALAIVWGQVLLRRLDSWFSGGYRVSTFTLDSENLSSTYSAITEFPNILLDVTFGEDDSRIRTGHAPENMAILRRWSINLLNQETSFKRSTRQKLKRASMDEAYMLKVLGASIPLQSNP
jgi:hypothetical protein